MFAPAQGAQPSPCPALGTPEARVPRPQALPCSTVPAERGEADCCLREEAGAGRRFLEAACRLGGGGGG